MGNDPRDMETLIRMPVEWQETDDADFPYRTRLDNIEWRIRIDDFPDEPLFSLIREGKHVADFDDRPSFWKR